MTLFGPFQQRHHFRPAVVYIGGIDGKPTTTSATVPFPNPPASIGPNAPAPPSGSWPVRAVQPIFGNPESPLTGECAYLNFRDPDCITQPWFWNNITGGGSGPGDIENYWDLQTRCPPDKTSSTTSKTSPTPPAPSPHEQGDPRTNSVKCYNSGETTEDSRMQHAAASFCGDIKNDILGPGYFRSIDFPFPYNGGLGTVTITISLEIKPRCGFDFNMNLCKKYLSVAGGQL